VLSKIDFLLQKFADGLMDTTESPLWRLDTLGIIKNLALIKSFYCNTFSYPRFSCGDKASFVYPRQRKSAYGL